MPTHTRTTICMYIIQPYGSFMWVTLPTYCIAARTFLNHPMDTVANHTTPFNSFPAD